MTTDEQKKGLADYFAPASVSETTSGAGGVLAGTAMDDNGAKQTTDALRPQEMSSAFSSDNSEGGSAGETEVKYDEEEAPNSSSVIKQDFHSAAASIKQAWREMPNITEIENNLIVQETEEGLSILIVDREGRPMFPEGSKYPYEITRQAIAAIAPILRKMSNQIDISGHTAAGGVYENLRYGPWEFSSDRANIVRTILGEFGLEDDRVHAVAGRATAEPLFPNDPHLSGNERIEILVLNESPPVPPGLNP
jgi:chemotaxis protein MotB